MENILDKLNRDLKKASENLSDREARYLVDLYYQMQDFRIQATNQTRILTKEDAEEPHEVIGFMGGNYKTIEDNIKEPFTIIRIFTKTHHNWHQTYID